MLQVLNIGFIIFHTALIVFNLTGWMWKKTRRLNLITLLLTAFSWGVLGFWYGFGYCPCTDWHWQVRRALGFGDMPRSYIEFLAEWWTGLEFAASTANLWTGLFFVVALIVSFYANFGLKRNPNNK